MTKNKDKGSIRREPSLHIMRSDLKVVLESILGISKTKEILDELLAKSVKYSIPNRSVSISNQYAEKKLNKVNLSTLDDNSTMADCLWAYRAGKLKHKGVKKINQDSRDWGDLKELVSIANEYYNAFEDTFKSKREAYISYLEISFPKITSYYGLIRKLINMSEYVNNYKESENAIYDDDFPTVTKEIHDYYCKKISSKTGINIDYSNDLNKYSHFLEVRKTCDKLDGDYFTYIEAQFESLSWRNGIPEPSMLNGEKAIERLNKFIYETGSSVKKKSKESVKSLKNLKNIK